MASTKKLLNEIMKEVKNNPLFDIVNINAWTPIFIQTGVPYLVSRIFETAALFASSNEGSICLDEIRMNEICEFSRDKNYDLVVKPGTIVRKVVRKYKYDERFIIRRFYTHAYNSDKDFGDLRELYCILESVVSSEYEHCDTNAIVTLYAYAVIFLKYATMIGIKHAKRDGRCIIPIRDVVDLVVTYDADRDKYKAEFIPAKGFRKAIKAGEKYVDEQRQIDYQEFWNTP